MYKKLEIWNDSIKLIKDIYRVTENLPKSEEFNLKNQIKRAVVSVALNIAEGKNRQSAKDFAHFLNISIASLGEVDACIEICKELNYLYAVDDIQNDCKKLIKRINALKKSITKEHSNE